MTKNGKGTAPRKQNKNKKPNKQKKSGGTSPGGVTFGGGAPGPLRMLAAPAAVAQGSSRRNYATIVSRGKGKDGLDTIRVKFHQYFHQCLARNTGSFLFTSSDLAPVAGLPLSPISLGSAVSLIAAPWQLYRFENISAEFVPSVGTSQPGSVAVAYIPPNTDSKQTMFALDESEGGVLGGLYRSLLSASTVAAGPVWGPLVAVVGDLAEKKSPLLKESFIKWFRNMTASFSFNANSVNDVESLDLAAQRNEDFETALHAYLKDNAASLPAGILPDRISTDLTSVKERQMAAMARAVRQSIEDALTNTSQGSIMACLDQPYAGTVATSGGYAGTAVIGAIWVSGEITFTSPFPVTTTNLVDSGNPLDLADPGDVPRHLAYSPADRFRYLKDAYLNTIFVNPALSESRALLESVRGQAPPRVVYSKREWMVHTVPPIPEEPSRPHIEVEDGEGVRLVPTDEAQISAATHDFRFLLRRYGFPDLPLNARDNYRQQILDFKSISGENPPPLLVSAFGHWLKAVGAPLSDVRFLETTYGFFV